MLKDTILPRGQKLPVDIDNLFVARARPQIGIVETTEAFEALIALKKVVEDAKANDGRIDAKDVPLLFGIFPSLLAAISGGEKIPAELDDLDDNELEFLANKFGEAFESPNFRKMFYGLALIADAIHDEINDRKAKEAALPA